MCYLKKEEFGAIYIRVKEHTLWQICRVKKCSCELEVRLMTFLLYMSTDIFECLREAFQMNAWFLFVFQKLKQAKNECLMCFGGL